MRTPKWLMLHALIISFALSACGGGGSNSSTSNNGSNTLDTTALAASAQMTASFTPETKVVTLSWMDIFSQGTQYAVQEEASDGSFTTLEIMTGAGGSNAQLTWQRPLTESTTFRIQAIPVNGVPVTLLTAQKQTSVNVSVSSATPQITLSAIEPVSDTVQLSIDGGVKYLSVNWYVDTRLIGQGAGSNGNPIDWDTASQTSGEHLIIARIQTSTDSYIDVRRTVQVFNVKLALTAKVTNTADMIYVNVIASSAVGIARVDGSLDGNPASSLTEPNACWKICVNGNDAFGFTVNPVTAGSGNHTMRITAIDGQNNSKTITVAVPVNNSPVLSITAPVDGAFAFGSLHLTGAVTSDKDGTIITTTASLGQLEFMNTTNASFSSSLDLTGLPPKTYTLTVTAKDSSGATTIVQRNINVASSASLTYNPILDIGSGGQLLAAEGKRLLYKNGQGSYWLRDTDIGTEVALVNADTVAYATRWQINDGRVYVQGKDSDCLMTCIYQWNSDGSRTNLSLASTVRVSVTGFSQDDHGLTVRGNYAIWLSDTYVTVYNISTNSFTKIDKPAEMSYFADDTDAIVIGGNLLFFFSGQNGGVGMNSMFDVYRWDESAGAITKLSGGGARNFGPQTDGLNVIWKQSPVGDDNSSTSLISQPVVGGSSETLSSSAKHLIAADGVDVWIENIDVTPLETGNLKARYAGSTRTLSSLGAATLYGNSGGYVVFGEQGRTYSWNAASNTTTLRIESSPGQTLICGGYLYFAMGSSGNTIYRIGL